MQLTLYLPGLLLPESILADGIGDLSAPALSLLLGRSKRRALPADWLAGRFGTHGPLPAAALRKVDAGGTVAGDLICLDPVHFRVSRDGITLDDPAGLALAAEETAALIDSIAPLFADWGCLTASSPGHWELQLHRPLDLMTQPLPEVVGRQVDPAYPGGVDGRAWRRLIAEAQTLLHAHPLNRNGKVSSVWPWGQGCLPPGVLADFEVIWAADPVIAGLASLAGLPCLQPPDRFQIASGHVLAIVPDLLPGAATMDVLSWRECLLSLEHHWFAPALAACTSRQCRQLAIVGTSGGTTPRVVCHALTPGDLLRFWRRPRSLSALA